MLELVMEHAGTLAVIVGLMTTAALLTARWESASLWLLSTWHSAPWIGGIAWLTRRVQPGRAGERAQTAAVMSLCSDYARYVRVLNRADYDNYMNYLRKAGDLGRRPFPPFLWFVIFSMVIVEAAGFAYVLAGWTLPGASEVMQQVAAVGIGFLVAVIMVFFTHWAGVEMYQSNQHRRDRREWAAAGKVGPLYGPDLSLNDPQSVDDAEPSFRQRATRGHAKTTYLLTLVTLVMVASIGGGAAYVRGQVLEQELVVEAASRQRAVERFDAGGAATAARERVAIDRQAIQQEIEIKRRGGWGTLIVLVIIFFFLQVLGMFFGFRYSFNGRLSHDCYRALNADRFSSYGELVEYYERIADIAQSKVEALLQQLERRRSGALGPTWSGEPPSFRDYLQMREAQRRDKPLGGELGSASATLNVTPALPAPATLPAVVVESAATVAAEAAPAAHTAVVDPQTLGHAPAATTNGADTVQGPSTAARFVESLSAVPVVPGAAATDDTLGPATLSPRAMLEEAEIAERKRAAERHARLGKAPARGKGRRINESESG
jgi:hypothetical protein